MRKIAIWLLAALLLQLSVYEYLDRVLLAPAAGFTQTVDGTAGPSGGSTGSYSYDKSYYADFSLRDLKIYATRDNSQVRNIRLQTDQVFTYFTWLPNRNLALAAISTNYARSTTVTLLSIDPETNSQPVSPRVVGLARGARITDVAFSTQTNVTNILIRSGTASEVYRTDANNYLRKLYLGTWSIDRIASLTAQDVLLYDDSVSKAVYAYYANGRRARVRAGGLSSLALIGADKNDNVYLGRLVYGDMVSEIWEGRIDGSFREIRSLDTPYPAGSISVNYDGTITFS